MSTSSVLPYSPLKASPPAFPRKLFVPAPHDTRYWLILMLLLALLYALVESGHWYPGTDTAFYIGVARSLAQGDGFRFNGGPVGRVPPLWPLVLAGAMKISTSFWFLNFIPAACLVASAGCWYWIIRRIASPARAFWAVLLSGMLFYVYVSAVQLRSEALFCLVFSSSLLMGVRIGEGRTENWRIALTALLCALMVGVRWTGLVCWLPVAGAALSGELRPRLNRNWICAALIAVSATASFFGFRLLLQMLPARAPETALVQNGQAPAKGGLLPDDMDSPPVPVMQAIMTRGGIGQTIGRFGNSGNWMSSLLWMPMYFGVTSKLGALVSDPVGWICIILFLVCLWQQTKMRQWMWLGVLMYCGALIFRWRVTNPRYLIPVAPLLLAGTWVGIAHLAEANFRPIWQRWWRFCLIAFPISLVLVNGLLWAVDVYISRSSDFYSRYMAGEMDRMISAAKLLSDRGVKDGEISISFSYINLGRVRKNNGLRSMHLLTGHLVRTAPKKICVDEPNAALIDWAKKKDVKYYLYRPPISPWRAHHFKLGWLQKWMTKKKDIPVNPSWILYELREDGARVIDLPDVENWPDRVPAM